MFPRTHELKQRNWKTSQVLYSIILKGTLDCVEMTWNSGIGDKTYHARMQKWILKTNIIFYLQINGLPWQLPDNVVDFV